MSVLKQLRGELVDTLTGLTIYDHVPARASIPCAFVMAGAPYITASATYGARLVRFGVVLVTSSSLNEYETDELDERIEQAQRELESAGWLVEQVAQPEIQDLNGAEILATTITVATDAAFT